VIFLPPICTPTILTLLSESVAFVIEDRRVVTSYDVAATEQSLLISDSLP